MTEPRRWLDDESAPPELRHLLRHAPRARELDGRARARGFRRVQRVALIPIGIAAWFGAKTTLAALGTAAAVSATTIAAIEIVARIEEAREPAPADRASRTPPAPARVQSSPMQDPEQAPEAESPEPFEESEAAFDALDTALPPSVATNVVPNGRLSAPVPPRDSLLEESDLLDRARAAVVTDPRRTLVLAHEHARRFPNGQLASERIVLEIEGLYRAGRVTEARRRASAVLESSPNGLYAERVRRLLGQMGGP